MEHGGEFPACSSAAALWHFHGRVPKCVSEASRSLQRFFTVASAVSQVRL